MLLEQVLENRLEVLRHDRLCPILGYYFKEALVRFLSVEVVGIPVADKNLFVQFGSPTDLWQSLTSLFLLNPCEKHVAKDFWYF